MFDSLNKDGVYNVWYWIIDYDDNEFSFLFFFGLFMLYILLIKIQAKYKNIWYDSILFINTSLSKYTKDLYYSTYDSFVYFFF